MTDTLDAQLATCDRTEKFALALVLWQDGAMRDDSPDGLANLAVDTLRDRGWLNPYAARSVTSAFFLLWRVFLFIALVAVVGVALAIAGWVR